MGPAPYGNQRPVRLLVLDGVKWCVMRLFGEDRRVLYSTGGGPRRSSTETRLER
jgi:hypothetical protein